MSMQQAEELVRRELKTQLAMCAANDDQPLAVPCLLGPPGIGKTAIAESFAAEFYLPFCHVNSGETSDPTDVSGIPVPEPGQSYTEWRLNRYAAMACEEPVLFFVDDIDKAPPTVQGALLSIFGARRFRDRELHPGTLLMAAGNRLGDDMYANELSESIRTRLTIIEALPDLPSFVAYGQRTGKIHPAILGYLLFRPDHLFKYARDVLRFPTPRGWRECSQQFELFPEPAEDIFGTPNWQSVVRRKCGEKIGFDFWAWYTIIAGIDVEAILKSGKMPEANGDADKQRMQNYAATFAVSQWLNVKGVKPAHTGLPALTTSLSEEMRIAFLVQLNQKARTDIAKHFPAVATTVLNVVLRKS